MDNLCYQYQYDERGRQVQKKIPGKGWEYSIFNTMDQLVATQDANQRVNNNWIFKKYDGKGRAVITGIWNNSNTAISRATLQATLSGITSNLYEASVNSGNGYTNVAWPNSSVTANLTISYFDNYANIPGLPASYSAPSGADLATRGELTGTLTAVLNTPSNMLWAASYYDNWGRTLKSYVQHYLGGVLNTGNYDAISNTYDFTNVATTTTRQHFTSASSTTPLVTIANQYLYDHSGRKLKSWEQITNGTTPTTRTLLSQNVYNEVGQLQNKQLHSTDSTNFYQSITYAYNERGWILSSSAPLFSMQLQYNNSAAGKQYNGNIAYQSWTTPTVNDNFTYTYDKLNRLTSGTSADNYNETGITYDPMGNITALSRYQAGTLIDNLSYNYGSTNQLQTLSDISGNNTGIKAASGMAYSYDPNGNVMADPSRSTGTINYTYNLLNLPLTITGAKTITYTYDATGNKLRRASTVTGNTDYINGIQYDGGTLSFIQTEEGKAIPNGSAYTYEYHLGDNLGNSRVSFTTSGIVQQDDYFPFGMEISRNTNGTKNEYLYNGKELQEELGVYDYGHRMYDPVIARWTTIDPMAEKGRRWSPYVYGFDNSIRFEDPDGQWPDWLDNAVKQAKSSYNNAVATTKAVYNNAVSATKGAYKETVAATVKAGVETKKWTTDHKEALLNAAKNMQNYGDKTAAVGAVAAIAGAPIAGVGAAPGLTVAAAGKTVSTIGTVLEVGVELITGDNKNAAVTATNDVGYRVLGALGGRAVDDLMPVPIPGISGDIKEGAKQLAGLVESGVKSQTDKVVDKPKETEKK